MSLPSNRTIFQAFEWHTPSQPPTNHETHSEQSHYTRLQKLVPTLKQLGITAVWIPPGCKANNPHGNGYDCYDLWDLGEFDQKSSRATKWGSREELSDLIASIHDHGLEVIWDAVLNHKGGGDGTEETWAVEVDPQDRLVDTTDPKKIRAWLRYDFHGRASHDDSQLKYSSMRWTAEHFNGTDWDDHDRRNAIYKLIDDPSQRAPDRQSKGWAEDVDDENGNADYLMLSNIDYTHPAVREDVLNWGRWMIDEVGVDGFRLDAAQHFSYNFTNCWIKQVNEAQKKRSNDREAFVVGEIWSGDVQRILCWMDAVGDKAHAYDSPLVYNFSHLSEDVRLGNGFADLRTVFRDTLVYHRPDQAVTLVTNHDTQPGQTSYTLIDPQLKALFYALILLRRDGYPCVFWGDLYGTKGPYAEEPSCCVKDSRGSQRNILPDLIMARKLWAYGSQNDYFDRPDCIGWTRNGDARHGACAVVLCINRSQPHFQSAAKRMRIGKPGEVWVDLMQPGYDRESVIIDTRGEGIFKCHSPGVAVFVKNDELVARSFPIEFDANVYRIDQPAA